MQIAEILQTMEYGPAPEAAGPALEWIRQRGSKFGLFINGEWHRPEDASLFETVNPATGETLAWVTQAREEDVQNAVRAAREAFPKWSALPGHIRARYLYAMARQVQKHARLLAVLESLDNGKPIRESRDIDIPLVARHFYHHAGWAQLLEATFPGYAPLGVVGQIIPWNFPLLMLAWKIAPALATGNTVVLKPAESTPLTALAFAEICQEVGLPPGVVNIITGDGRVGEMIVNHPDIDKLAFTGSTEVGRIIRRQSAGSGKRLTLELGGKSPFIVFDDADMDSAVEGLVDAIWFNQGQVCCAGSRLLVQESIYQRFLNKLKARMEKLRIGDPLDKAIDIGAVVSEVQLARIQRLVRQGQEEGATLWQPSCALPSRGCFFPPTLLTDVHPTSTVWREEIFGPVLVSATFRTPEEAVELGNNTRYGLAASVWTENINLALDVASRLKAGTVWINCTNLFDAASGFGGYRESGYGREGGREGLFEYLKPAWMKGLKPVVATEPAALANGAGSAPEGSGEQGQKPQTGEGTQPALTPRPAWPSMTNGTFAVPIDRTPKMYIGGRQVRPDAPYPRHIVSPQGYWVGEVGEGNRKDIRNAVEAAHKAKGWALANGHQRAQVLYYLAENLSARAEEFARRISLMTGASLDQGRREVEASIERLFSYAAWADKYEGVVHRTLTRHITLAMPEPIGVIGIGCPDECPLLAFVSLVAPAIAMGNTVVVVPSQAYPLAATDFYQVLDTSDVPGGVVNIVTGERNPLLKVLAEHDDVDAVWYMGDAEGSRMVEACSVGNMKRTWVNYGHPRDWFDKRQGEGEEFLREATQVKNIWVPYGE